VKIGDTTHIIEHKHIHFHNTAAWNTTHIIEHKHIHFHNTAAWNTTHFSTTTIRGQLFTHLDTLNHPILHEVVSSYPRHHTKAPPWNHQGPTVELLVSSLVQLHSSNTIFSFPIHSSKTSLLRQLPLKASQL